MLLVILAAAWKQISYNFLFFLAGLQAIPASLIEAAAIDGASAAPPILDDHLPAIGADQLLSAGRQYRLRLFRHVRDHPERDPGRAGQATEILVYKVWYDGVVGLDLGGSAAQSVILMAIVIALTAIQFRFIERRVHYA